jgi:hypothetical protein
MKCKLSILFFILSTSLGANAQWSNEIVNNGFDSIHKISTTKNYNGGYLKLVSEITDAVWTIKDVKVYFDTTFKFKYSPEYPDGKMDTIISERRENEYEWSQVENITLYLIGGFHCDDRPQVEIVFVVGGEFKKHVIRGRTFNDNRGMQLVDDVMGDLEFLDHFKQATLMKIRINEDYCEDSYYEFKMIGSSSAINFLSTE